MKENKRMERNLTMLVDFYELTMGQGFIDHRHKDTIAVFDMFFRRIPDKGGFALMFGVEQMIEYLRNLKFTNEDISYLRSKNMFSEDFLNYLKEFEFKCDVWAIEEGTPIFPNEPIVTVRGPILQAQLVETMILLTINHQSLIGTKTNRIVRAAEGRPVMEFGSRRAQGYDGAIIGARAAYVAGAIGTACAILERDHNIPAIGTMAHSWVQFYDSELDAFKAYCESFPDNATLLVDTYNVLKSGVPNAIKAAKEILEPMGKRLKGIRLDSGDLAYLSIESRKMLDNAGMQDCKIVVSNSLDEYTITSLLSQGAKIDLFGVGERLITAKSEPVFGGVYKLVGVYKEDKLIPKIKISENVEKITNPDFKQVYRLYDNNNGKAIADVLTLHDEIIDQTKPYTIFDPVCTWKRKTITNFIAKKLLVPIFEKGKLVYETPNIEDIRNNCLNQVDTLWDEVKRFHNPHIYYVDLSQKLWDIKQNLLNTLTIK